MQIEISFNGKKKVIVARECGIFRKGFGLMFRSRNTDNLLFSFGKDVNRALTANFVFFPFLVVWLDERNRVIETRIVKPFTTVIYAKKNYRKIIELPFNNKNNEIIKFLVGKKGLNR